MGRDQQELLTEARRGGAGEATTISKMFSVLKMAACVRYTVLSSMLNATLLKTTSMMLELR